MKQMSDCIGAVLNESFRNSLFGDAQEKIKSYFHKYKIYTRMDIVDVTVEGEKYFGEFVYSCDTMNGAFFLWHQGSRITELDSILFTNDAAKCLIDQFFGSKSVFPIEVKVFGASLGAILPLVKDVINGKTAMNKNEIKEFIHAHKLYNESLEDVESSLNFITEDTDLEMLRRQRNTLSVKISTAKRKGRDYSDLQSQYDEIRTKIGEYTERVGVRTNVKTVISSTSNEIEQQEEEFEQRATPEERFSDMEHYINMVLKGMQPGLLICGAPGVGKTFRVMRKVKASGRNYWVIKGKETALAFYMDLFKYHHEGDIIVADDADDVLTDDTITNLIKAALDSGDERIVTYGTSKPPVMPAEEFMSLSPEDQALCPIDARGNAEVYLYPKSFETKGSMIIITNKSAGQVDTAVRNRCLVCDLSFTVEECLKLVRDIMPAIMPNKLSKEAKMKAMSYLEELAASGSSMDISIRSFTTVAKVYEDVDDDTQANRMIREQMKLQSMRGGKKY